MIFSELKDSITDAEKPSARVCAGGWVTGTHTVRCVLSESKKGIIGITTNNGLVPSIEVLKEIDRIDWGSKIPDWVDAWSKAESQRPWPKE